MHKTTKHNAYSAYFKTKAMILYAPGQAIMHDPEEVSRRSGQLRFFAARRVHSIYRIIMFPKNLVFNFRFKQEWWRQHGVFSRAGDKMYFFRAENVNGYERSLLIQTVLVSSKASSFYIQASNTETDSSVQWFWSPLSSFLKRSRRNPARIPASARGVWNRGLDKGNNRASSANQNWFASKESISRRKSTCFCDPSFRLDTLEWSGTRFSAVSFTSEFRKPRSNHQCLRTSRNSVLVCTISSRSKQSPRFSFIVKQLEHHFFLSFHFLNYFPPLTSKKDFRPDKYYYHCKTRIGRD